MSVRRALWGLIAVSFIARLALSACLDVGNDEAYHYLFTIHPAWSYYDHPPMIALIESAGLMLAGGIRSATALRFGFLVLFCGSTILMWRLATRLYGESEGLVAAFILCVTAYYGIAAGTFALPDGPLLFFWLLTLDRLCVALTAPGRVVPWLYVGVAWGAALLSKYHAVFIPLGTVLFVMSDRTARPLLRSPGPYLAMALGLAVFSPVVVWNALNGWTSFAFQGARAIGDHSLRLDALAGAIAGQAMYVFPWIWIFLLISLTRSLRVCWNVSLRSDRFLLANAIPPLVVFLAVACQRVVLPHWSLVGLIPVFPLAARDWVRLRSVNPQRFRRRIVIFAILPFLLTSLVVAHTRFGVLQRGSKWSWGIVPVELDPTADLFGWDQVAQELRSRGLIGRPGTFVFSSTWFHSGQLAFATNNESPVLCYNPRDAHGFAQWSRPEQWIGQDGILVVIDPSSTEPEVYTRWFERIEAIGEFDAVRANAPLRHVRLYRCVHQTRPFPFDGSRMSGAVTGRPPPVSPVAIGDPGNTQASTASSRY